jgi:hypothetical protein
LPFFRFFMAGTWWNHRTSFFSKGLENS